MQTFPVWSKNMARDFKSILTEPAVFQHRVSLCFGINGLVDMQIQDEPPFSTYAKSFCICWSVELPCSKCLVRMPFDEHCCFEDFLNTY